MTDSIPRWPTEDKDKLWLLKGRFPWKIIARVLERSPGACAVQFCRMKRQRSDRKPIMGNVSQLQGTK